MPVAHAHSDSSVCAVFFFVQRPWDSVRRRLTVSLTRGASGYSSLFSSFLTG